MTSIQLYIWGLISFYKTILNETIFNVTAQSLEIVDKLISVKQAQCFVLIDINKLAKEILFFIYYQFKICCI